MLQPLTLAGPSANPNLHQAQSNGPSSSVQPSNGSAPYGLSVALANLAQANQPQNPSAPSLPKTPTFDSLDLIQKYFTVVPLNELNNNPFVWDKPEMLKILVLDSSHMFVCWKIPKFPTKCLDNYSVVNFAEEAFYIPSEVLAARMNSIFFDLDYPSYPKYFIDPTVLLIKKQPLAVKGDVYALDSKPLLEKFRALAEANSKLKKVLLPVYYYYQYEGNYQMVGYIKYEVYGKSDEFFKLEFKHYPLKYLQLHEVLTNHKNELVPKLEKIIESLPRYSLNFYHSILKLNNVPQLQKKRYKFMFGFSNKPASRSLEEDYEKHGKRVREIIIKKSQICEQLNKYISEKQLKINEKRKLRASSSQVGMSSASQFSLDRSSLDPTRLFTMSTNEIERELQRIHSGILSSNFLLGSLPASLAATGADSEPQEPIGQQVVVLNSMSNTSPFEWRQAAFVEETKYIKEPLAYRNPFKLMIRPRNQVLQLNEIEDEAFLTNDEKKKKSNKLASYAIVYKQHVSNKLKQYGQRHE